VDVEKRHSIPALDRQAAAAILAAMVQMSHQGKLVVAQVVQTRDREELFSGETNPGTPWYWFYFSRWSIYFECISAYSKHMWPVRATGSGERAFFLGGGSLLCSWAMVTAWTARRRSPSVRKQNANWVSTSYVRRCSVYPEEFLSRLDSGEFDDRVTEEIGRISNEELERVAVLMSRPIRGKAILELSRWPSPMPHLHGKNP